MKLSKIDLFGILLLSAFLFLVNLYVFRMDPVYAVLAVAGLFVAFIMLRSYKVSMFLIIVLLPIASNDLMQTQIMGIPGFKPTNVIFILFILSFILSKRHNRIFEKMDVLFYLLFTVAFFIATIRSTSYVPNYYAIFWEGEYSTFKYILSYWLIPFLISVVFIVTLVYIRSEEDLQLAIKAVFLSMSIFSCFIIYYYVYNVPIKNDFEKVRDIIAGYMGMHGNGLSAIFITTFPLIFIFTLQKVSPLRIITLGLSLFSVAILYSRTAYFTILAMAVVILILKKKVIWLPIGAVILSLTLTVIPGNVMERAMTGIEGGDINEISAGRVDAIWIPILHDLRDNPEKIVTGYGLYGVLDTNAFKTRKVLTVNHSHNAYLNTVLDSGIFCLLIFLMFYFKMIKNMLEVFLKSRDEFQKNLALAMLLSLVSHMIKGITGGSLLPDASNSFIWVFMAFSCVVWYNYEYKVFPEKYKLVEIAGGQGRYRMSSGKKLPEEPGVSGESDESDLPLDLKNIVTETGGQS